MLKHNHQLWHNDPYPGVVIEILSRAGLNPNPLKTPSRLELFSIIVGHVDKYFQIFLNCLDQLIGTESLNGD